MEVQFFWKLKHFILTLRIFRVIERFNQYGTLEDRRHELPGPSRTVTTDNVSQRVEEYFKKYPNDSLRRTSKALQVSKSSLHRILKYFLTLILTKLPYIDYSPKKRWLIVWNFVNNLVSCLNLENWLLKIVLFFSEKAHFSLGGFVNKQSFRFWGTEPPHFIEFKSLPPKKSQHGLQSLRKAFSLNSSTVLLLMEKFIASSGKNIFFLGYEKIN